MNNILASLLSDKMQCWILTDDDDQIQAICTTMIMTDDAANNRYLLIYSLYAYDNVVEHRFWDTGFDELKKYARKRGCISLNAYSNDPAVDKIARRVNANRDNFYTFQL